MRERFGTRGGVLEQVRAIGGRPRVSNSIRAGCTDAIEGRKARPGGWWFWAAVIATIVVSAVRTGASSNSTRGCTSRATPTSALAENKSNPAAIPGPLLPDDQEHSIDLVVGSQVKARAADTDMQRGGAMADRDKEMCAVVSKMRIRNGVGMLAEISANRDGLGVPGIELAKDPFLRTCTDARPDLFDTTLAPSGPPLSNPVSQRGNGTRVKVSGVFLLASGMDRFREASLALSADCGAPVSADQGTATDPRWRWPVQGPWSMRNARTPPLTVSRPADPSASARSAAGLPTGSLGASSANVRPLNFQRPTARTEIVGEGRTGKMVSDRCRVQPEVHALTTITSPISEDGNYRIQHDPARSRSLAVRETAGPRTCPENRFLAGRRTAHYHRVGSAVRSQLADIVAEVLHAVPAGG